MTGMATGYCQDACAIHFSEIRLLRGQSNHRLTLKACRDTLMSLYSTVLSRTAADSALRNKKGMENPDNIFDLPVRNMKKKRKM